MHSTYFGEKHEFIPFENITPIEELSQKYDVSLFSFCSHNKKRPNNIVLGILNLYFHLLTCMISLLFIYLSSLGRMFDYHLLDMIELGIEQFKSLAEIKTSKVMTGTKPCMIFSGEVWNQNEEYSRFKSLLIDFFRGEEVEQVLLTGFEHALTFTAADGKIFLRSYK